MVVPNKRHYLKLTNTKYLSLVTKLISNFAWKCARVLFKFSLKKCIRLSLVYISNFAQKCVALSKICLKMCPKNVNVYKGAVWVCQILHKNCVQDYTCEFVKFCTKNVYKGMSRCEFFKFCTKMCTILPWNLSNFAQKCVQGYYTALWICQILHRNVYKAYSLVNLSNFAQKICSRFMPCEFVKFCTKMCTRL